MRGYKHESGGDPSRASGCTVRLGREQYDIKNSATQKDDEQY